MAQEMTSRERVLTAMGHEEPDRVPLFYRDIRAVEQRLLKEIGLGGRDVLLELLHVDSSGSGEDKVNDIQADGTIDEARYPAAKLSYDELGALGVVVG